MRIFYRNKKCSKYPGISNFSKIWSTQYWFFCFLKDLNSCCALYGRLRSWSRSPTVAASTCYGGLGWEVGTKIPTFSLLFFEAPLKVTIANCCCLHLLRRVGLGGWEALAGPQPSPPTSSHQFRLLPIFKISLQILCHMQVTQLANHQFRLLPIFDICLQILWHSRLLSWQTTFLVSNTGIILWYRLTHLALPVTQMLTQLLSLFKIRWRDRSLP